MRTSSGREQDLESFTNEELRSFYQKINTALAQSLLGGASLEDQQENIRMLNQISKELNRRKAFTGAVPGSEKVLRS